MTYIQKGTKANVEIEYATIDDVAKFERSTSPAKKLKKNTYTG